MNPASRAVFFLNHWCSSLFLSSWPYAWIHEAGLQQIHYWNCLRILKLLSFRSINWASKTRAKQYVALLPLANNLFSTASFSTSNGSQKNKAKNAQTKCYRSYWKLQLIDPDITVDGMPSSFIYHRFVFSALQKRAPKKAEPFKR